MITAAEKNITKYCNILHHDTVLIFLPQSIFILNFSQEYFRGKKIDESSPEVQR